MDIRRAHQALEEARRNLDAAVQAARAQGRTWAQIGEELGMTRQAAFKRFGRPVDPSTGDEITPRSVRDVVDLTERVFALIAAGDYDQLTPLMHPQTLQEIPPALIADTWRKVLTEVGALERCEGTHVELPGGTAIESDEQVVGTVVGATTLECEAGSLHGRVAVSDESLVVGMLLVPTDHGPLPF